MEEAVNTIGLQNQTEKVKEPKAVILSKGTRKIAKTTKKTVPKKVAVKQKKASKK